MNLKLTLLLSAFAAGTALPQSVFAGEQKPIILAQQQTPDKSADDKKPAKKPPAQANQPQAKPTPAKPAQAKPAATPQNKPAQNAQTPKTQPAAKPAPAKPAAAKKDTPAASPAKKDTPAAAQTGKEPATKPAATTPQHLRQPGNQRGEKSGDKPARQPAAAQDKTPATKPGDEKAAAAARDAAPKKIEAARSERKETKEGNRTVIRENNRTIVKVNNTTIIRHDDTDRFRHGGGDVRVNRRGDRTETVIVRPGGVRIVNVMDDRGRLIRRTRWVNGREYVLIDNRYDRRREDGFSFVVNLAPPVVHIPRDRYIVDYRVAPRPVIYETLVAPPVMALDRRFTLDEIRYNAVVRERMPVIDIDSITFESGSWEVTPDQAALLEPLAEAMGRAIAKNPAEVYLVGGHTDSTGEPDDNLSLSDRRAEAVAEILTSRFNIPPENLVTQGYGEMNLRVNVQGPEPRNRYVSIRRITPLLKAAQQ